MAIIRGDFSELYRRLYRRFGLKTTQVALNPGIADYVLPVIDAVDILGEQVAEDQTTAISATGVTPVWTCPDNQEWEVLSMYFFLDSGVLDWDYYFWYPRDWTFSVGSQEMLLYAEGGGAVSQRWIPNTAQTVNNMFPKRLIMRPGDNIRVNISSVTTPGDMVCRVFGIKKRFF